jgi:drug/metabolite transporter (DMT)-like permease
MARASKRRAAVPLSGCHAGVPLTGRTSAPLCLALIAFAGDAATPKPSTWLRLALVSAAATGVWILMMREASRRGGPICAVVLRDGLVSVVAVLASLYPVVTAAAAHVVLGERLTVRRRAATAVIVTGVLLVALGS